MGSGGHEREVGGKPQLTLRLASPRGFCAGVDRAIEIVEILLEQHGAPVYVRHQIVHNAHVVRDLEERGAVFVENESERGLLHARTFHNLPISFAGSFAGDRSLVGTTVELEPTDATPFGLFARLSAPTS